jgi:spermidine synthase
MRILAYIDGFFERYFPLWSLPIVAAILFVMVMLAKVLEPDQRKILVYSVQSAFQKITVYDQTGIRCLQFGEGDVPRQSCFALKKPQFLLFNYSRMMLGSLYLNPRPNKVLIIGLGGGVLSRALHELVPEADITTVELDPAVAQIAETYFQFVPSAKQHLVIADGRKFIEEAVQQGKHYDLIMLDAYDAHYIPLNLMSVEFLQAVKSLLTTDGVVAANTFSSSDLSDRESATYHAVFGGFYNLTMNNRIILTKNSALPPLASIKQEAENLEPALSRLGVDTAWLKDLFTLSSPEHSDAPLTLHDASTLSG